MIRVILADDHAVLHPPELRVAVRETLIRDRVDVQLRDHVFKRVLPQVHVHRQAGQPARVIDQAVSDHVARLRLQRGASQQQAVDLGVGFLE